MDTWEYTVETWRHGDIKLKNGSPGDFPSSVYRLLIVQRKLVVCLFVDEETYKSDSFANGLIGLNRLGYLWYLQTHFFLSSSFIQLLNHSPYA
jgi:hypothetical protein